MEEKIIPLYHLEDAPDLTGGVIEEAREQIGSQAGSTAGQPIVLLDMNNDGAKQWSRITGANIGRRIAIVLDNKVHMAPFIREKIINGGTQIEGFADMNEAKDIAIESNKFKENFTGEIIWVVGDEWHAGNLSYHLKSKPKWYSYSGAFVDRSAENFIQTIGKNGFIIVNGECPHGVSFEVKGNKICMSGNK